MAVGAAPPAVLFILDVSGSMTQKLGDRTKMQAAKDAFVRLLGDLNADLPVGLEVYGHRGDKDCSAIEMAQPIDPLDAATIRSRVSALEPHRGATPIVGALEKAGEALASRPGDRAIVLISDGEETCGGDPIAVASRLRDQQEIHLLIHVVGLAVNDAEPAQLAHIFHRPAAALENSLRAIEKKVGAKGSTLVFQDEFDGEALGKAWEVIRPSKDEMLVEGGKLILLLQDGWPMEGTNRNMLLYSGKLPKSYAVETFFQAELVDYPDFRPWETQRVGLVLYKNPKDLIELTTSTSGVASGHQLQVNFGKYKRDKWVAGYNRRLAKQASFDVKIEKKGHEYTAFVRGPKGAWLAIGSVTDLRRKYRPGILAYRAPNAKEIEASYPAFLTPFLLRLRICSPARRFSRRRRLGTRAPPVGWSGHQARVAARRQRGLRRASSTPMPTPAPAGPRTCRCDRPAGGARGP